MKRLRTCCGLGLGIAVFGALLGAVQAQASDDGLVSGGAGWLTRSGEASGETISAKPLNGSAAKTGVVEVVKAEPAPAMSAQGGDNWLSAVQGSASEKSVQNASPSGAEKVATSNVNVPASERTVNVGEGLRPVTPGHATTLSAPYFSDVVAVAAPDPQGSAVLASTQLARRRSGSGVRFVAGNGYMNNAGYGPVNFPPYQYPYLGYNNNPFTGLSSYSNGYAGGPPSTVPFAGGLHQGRSAFWSQPTMTVPNVNYGVGNAGGVGGAYGTGYGGPAIQVSGGYRQGGGPRRMSNNGGGGGNSSGNAVNVNVNYQQNQNGGGYGYGYGYR